MLFPTPPFTLFFLLVAAAAWSTWRRRRVWTYVLIAASYVFYASWDWRHALLLAVFTLGVFGGSKAIVAGAKGSRGRKWALGLSVSACVFVLATYKYFGFFVASAIDWLYRLGLTVDLAIIELVVPVGMSFTVFRAISYLVDVHREKVAPPGLADFVLFMSYFPYVSSGPLQRADDFLDQLTRGRDPRRLQLSRALLLIGLGLTKKMLIADYLLYVVEEPFLAPDMFSSADVLFAIYAYGVQLYCDFSGYIDLALGISLLLGIELPANFNRPYSSASLREFWRRWNMTLSSWLRDYVYIPLGGNRVGKAREAINLVVTMTVAGLWHGAGWGFIIWGVLHGAALAIERTLAPAFRRVVPASLRVSIGWLLTFNFVMLAWVFFRSESVAEAFMVLSRLLGAWMEPNVLLTPVSVLVVLLVVVSQFLPDLVLERIGDRYAILNPAVQGALLGAAAFLVFALGPDGPSNFIYSGF